MSKDQQAMYPPDSGCGCETQTVPPLAGSPQASAQQPSGYQEIAPGGPGAGAYPYPGQAPAMQAPGPFMQPGPAPAMGFAPSLPPRQPVFAPFPPGQTPQMHAAPMNPVWMQPGHAFAPFYGPASGQPPMFAGPYPGYGVFPGQPPAYAGPAPGVGAPSGHADTEGCDCSDSSHASSHAGGAGRANLKHDMNQYGQLYGMVREAASGSPDVGKFLDFFSASSTDFWKGALVGAGLTLLLTNDVVKGAISGAMANVWGAFSKSAEEVEAEEDRKAEARAAKEG